MVMKALSGKIDGVMVLGCHIGDCHYIDGNHRTKKRFALLKPLLECIGIDSRRLSMKAGFNGARLHQKVFDSRSL